MKAVTERLQEADPGKIQVRGAVQVWRGQVILPEAQVRVRGAVQVRQEQVVLPEAQVLNFRLFRIFVFLSPLLLLCVRKEKKKPTNAAASERVLILCLPLL